MRIRLIRPVVLIPAVILSTLLLYGTIEMVRRLVDEIYGSHPKRHNVTNVTRIL